MGDISNIAYFDFSVFRMLAEKCWHSSGYPMDPGKKHGYPMFPSTALVCLQPFTVLSSLLPVIVASPK